MTLSAPNMEIAASRSIPTQGLIRGEEIFHVPALGEFPRQGLGLITVGGREEGLEMVFLRPLPRLLDELV